MTTTHSLPPGAPAPGLASAVARLAVLTALAMQSTSLRQPVAAALAHPPCPRSCASDPRCAGCPFARPPSE